MTIEVFCPGALGTVSVVDVALRGCRTVVAGETRAEAKAKNLRFYVGPLCCHGHEIKKGAPVKSSLWYFKSGLCVMCSKEKARRSARRDKSLVNPVEFEAGIKETKARHSNEDRLLAKEMGITVEELLG